MDDPKCNTDLNHSYIIVENQQFGYVSIQRKSGKSKLLLQLWITSGVLTLRKKESLAKTLAKMFSCDVCKIFKNSFFYRTPLVAPSGRTKFRHK